MDAKNLEAKLIAGWLETRRTDWVRVNAYWKQLADRRLARDLVKNLGMEPDSARQYVGALAGNYRSKGWIR